MNARLNALHSFLLLLFVLLVPAFTASRLVSAFAPLDAEHARNTAQVEVPSFGGIPVAELHPKASARPAAVLPS